MKNLTLVEIERWTWSDLYFAQGESADWVPGVMRRMVESDDPDEIEICYLELEQRAFAQGQLFECVPALLSVAMAALASRPKFELPGFLLELIFQIVNGVAHEEAVERGHRDIGDGCRSMAREGLWLFYGFILTEHRERALHIVRLVDPDQDRVARYAKGG